MVMQGGIYLIEIKKTNIESIGKIFTVKYVENNKECEETFYIYTYERLMSIKWNNKLIHLQPLKIDKYDYHTINVRRSGKPDLPVDEIRNRIKTIEGMSKEEFTVYCLDMLKLYHEIVDLIGEYEVRGSDDEWEKHTKVYIDSPYSSMFIGTVQGSMSGFSPSIDRMQDRYFEKLNTK
jgi:hypothetical protein